MNDQRTVTVVGAGSWGTTLAKILGENGNRVLLWARSQEVVEEIRERRVNQRYLPDVTLPDTIHPTTDLQEVCEGSKLLFVVVPSHGFRSVVRRMGDFVHGEQALVHCTKGIEQGTYLRMSQIVRQETCIRKIGVLSGPNLAVELAKRQPGGTLVVSRFREVVKAAQAALGCSYFQVYGGEDVIGAEVAGAFKNIVAVAAGVLDGLGMGDNTKALLLTRGLTEMAAYGVSMGAQAYTFGGLAGIGDLMATCASPLSRNHQVGERLARGQTLQEIQAEMFMVAEGVKTAKAVYEYAVNEGVELPIATAVYRVLYEGLDVREALERLMSMRVGREFAGLRL